MSVIIKGMKKPSNCIWIEKCVGYKCPLLNDEDCCNLQDCKEEWTWADQYAGCPLIPLPEHHGRLIDADAIYNEMECGIRAGNLEEGYEKYSNINNMDDCLDCVKYADTVIEAEG